MRLIILVLLAILTSCSFVEAQRVLETGKAKFYADSFHGRKTSFGDVYNKDDLTAAHRSLPKNTLVRVTNLKNSKSVVVRINDEGPFVDGYVTELSRKAAASIGLVQVGEGRVKLQVVTREQLRPKNESSEASKKVVEKPEAELNVLEEAKQMDVGGLYKMQVLKLEPSGYGVQVATYSDYDGVLTQIAALQDNWFKGAMVFVDEKEGKRMYKVILGPFFTKPEAESYHSSLKKKYNIEGFVVSLEELDGKKVTPKKK